MVEVAPGLKRSNSAELRAVADWVNAKRQENIDKLQDLAERYGGKMVKSMLAAPAGWYCVDLNIIPHGEGHPLFAFQFNQTAQKFIQAAQEENCLAPAGNVASTWQPTMVLNGLRRLRSLFRGA